MMNEKTNLNANSTVVLNMNLKAKLKINNIVRGTYYG